MCSYKLCKYKGILYGLGYHFYKLNYSVQNVKFDADKYVITYSQLIEFVSYVCHILFTYNI